LSLVSNDPNNFLVATDYISSEVRIFSINTVWEISLRACSQANELLIACCVTGKVIGATKLQQLAIKSVK
jgi:hypothetical protein